MTDEQIIKALECCATDDGCADRCRKDALVLINRQKAEIESLKQIIDEQDKEIIKLQKRIIFWREDLNYQPEKIKSEAIKEFAERLIRTADGDDEYGTVFVFNIDSLVEEMTEEQ